MGRGLIVLVMLLGLYSIQGITCDQDGKTGIVEENDLYISTDAKSVSSLTEAQFNSVLDRVEAIYAPIVAAKNKKLVIERKWSDGTVNAYARQAGKNWEVSMFGGLARHETITADGFALVACHEVGHHLGGAPKKRSLFSTWASNEGQADYFATLKCFRKYAETENNIELMNNVEVPELVINKCKTIFGNEEDIAICKRGAMGGMSLGSLFRALRNLRDEIAFHTPDPKVVNRTDDSHPQPQCRLDTYFAGSICNQNPYEDVSDRNPEQATCSRKNKETEGIRPLCWYRP